jgi:Holliday junction resolvasome RuvABC endonuclease subunit
MTVIISIDPSTTVTGWAVFSHEPLEYEEALGQASPAPIYPISPDQSWLLVETGIIIAHNRPKRVEVSERIQAIKDELSRMVDKWQPVEVACGKPAALQLPYQQQGIEMLGITIENWAAELDLSFHIYHLREVREAILGRATAAKEELAYAVMNRWGLLGIGKSSHEWCALAVGDYHLARRRSESVLSA